MYLYPKSMFHPPTPGKLWNKKNAFMDKNSTYIWIHHSGARSSRTWIFLLTVRVLTFIDDEHCNRLDTFFVQGGRLKTRGWACRRDRSWVGCGAWSEWRHAWRSSICWQITSGQRGKRTERSRAGEESTTLPAKKQAWALLLSEPALLAVWTSVKYAEVRPSCHVLLLHRTSCTQTLLRRLGWSHPCSSRSTVDRVGTWRRVHNRTENWSGLRRYGRWCLSRLRTDQPTRSPRSSCQIRRTVRRLVWLERLKCFYKWQGGAWLCLK